MDKKYFIIPQVENYLISKCGSIYSLYVNRELSNYYNNKGYLCIKLQINGVTKTHLISRLLAHVFLNLTDLYDTNLHVDHIDRDITNNYIDNLQVLDKESHYKKSCEDQGLTKHKTRYCYTCNKKLDRLNTSGFCNSHRNRIIKGINLKIEDIEYWVRNYSWTRAAKELSMSDNGLRKRYKKLTGKDPKEIK